MSDAVQPVPVVWWPDSGKGGCWDHSMIARLLDGHLARPPGWPGMIDVETTAQAAEVAGGAIVCVSGAYRGDEVPQLNADLERLGWVLLIVTTDEEHKFPLREVVHPNLIIWRQLPRVDHPDYELVDHGFGEGPPPGTEYVQCPRDLDWSFAGQLTHNRRWGWWQYLSDRQRERYGEETAMLLGTPSFTDGVARPEYLRMLSRSRAVICPPGPETQSSFRMFEALECGAVPIVEETRPDGHGAGYWEAIFVEPPPFPITDYDDDPDVAMLIAQAESVRLETWAWWDREKRHLASALIAHLIQLGALPPHEGRLRDALSVVVTSSAIPSHPSRAILEETLESLPSGVEVIVGFDGVPAHLQHLTEDYRQYVDEILGGRLGATIVPVVTAGHVHQANLVRACLRQVATPYVLMVEHDTPIYSAPGAEVPWADLLGVLSRPADQVDVIRLYHEMSVPDEHRYLHDDVMITDGVELLRTRQWSQRPHLARTGWYRDMVAEYFSEDSRTMIEDHIHGVAQRETDRFRIAIYHPDGGYHMQRSAHLDGRRDEDKGPMHNHGKAV